MNDQELWNPVKTHLKTQVKNHGSENQNWKLLMPYVPGVMYPPTASPSTFGHFGIDTSSDSDKFVYVWSIVSLTLQFFGVSQTNIFSKMDLPILTRAKPSYTHVFWKK